MFDPIVANVRQDFSWLYEQQNSNVGHQIAQMYSSGQLKGYDEATSEIAQSLFGVFVQPFSIQGYKATSPKRMLYEINRKVLGHDTPNYPQEIGDCFVANTMVTMHNGGEKPIQDVEIGEWVLNHLGQPRKVIDKIHKKFSGELVTIKLKGWSRTLTATETHNALYLKNSTKRFAFKGFGKKKFADFQKGDQVILPYGEYYEFGEPEVIDLAKYTKRLIFSEDRKRIKRVNSKKWINRFIIIDKKFARLIGLYLAEGGCEKTGRINFSYNSSETDLIIETKKLLKAIFNLISSKDCQKPNCTSVRASSIIVTNFIKSLIPGNVYNKNIPDFFFRTHPRIRKALLRGWFDGDGHIKQERCGLIGVSSSEKLRYDIARLCLSVKIKPSLILRKKASHQTVAAGSVDVYGEYALQLYKQCENPHIARPITINRLEHGFARKIEKVSKEFVEDHDVYCIQVENEGTLVVNGIGQYNCVSFGGKNATEYVQSTEILLGKRQIWKAIFPPYYYGTSRCLIGNQHDYEDGSTGFWLAAAALKYGGIFADLAGLPKYSGNVAKKWGYSGPPKEYITEGQAHLIGSCVKINNWDELCAALDNGYPCTTASSVGYNMEMSSDGFHRRGQRWNHQMTFIGFGTKPEPYALILNNWGDVHGKLKDFDDNSDIPVGVLRVRKKDAEAHIAAKETFAWSQYNGMLSQNIDEALFKLFGR